MFKNIPTEIKKIYKISFFITIFSLIIGLILNKSELYLAFFIGSLISIINTYLMIVNTYKIIYTNDRNKFRGTFEYVKRILVYLIGMYLVIFISQKIGFKNLKTNIIFTGLGFLNFKISIFLKNIEEYKLNFIFKNKK